MGISRMVVPRGLQTPKAVLPAARLAKEGCDNMDIITVEALMRECGVAFGTSGARGEVSAMTDRVCYAYVRGFLAYLIELYAGNGSSTRWRSSAEYAAHSCRLRAGNTRHGRFAGLLRVRANASLGIVRVCQWFALAHGYGKPHSGRSKWHQVL